MAYPAQLRNRLGLGLDRKAYRPHPVYVFNGTDSYATKPDWTPLGLPFEVSLEAESRAADFSIEQMAYTSVGTFDTYFRLNNTGNIDWRYIDSSGTQQTKGHLHDPALFETFGVAFLSTAVDIIRISKGVAATTGGTTAPLQNSVGAIGINAALSATHWNGPIWNLRLTDNSPIQNTNVCMGDGKRYGQLNNPIVIPENHDFEIEFDWIRDQLGGSGGVSGVDVLRGEGEDRYLRVHDAGNPNPNQLTMRLSDLGTVWPNAFDSITGGQHCRVRVIRANGNTLTAYLDGKSLGEGSSKRSGSFEVETIGDPGNISFRANSAFQNLRISDLTAGKTWFYPLDEGSGTDIINTHPSTQDADYNGVWTPDTDWQFIPNNSRYYPMNEGAAGGGVFKDVIGGHDATIQNYRPADWENDTPIQP